MTMLLIVMGICGTAGGLIIGFVQGVVRSDRRHVKMHNALELIAGQRDESMTVYDNQGLWAKRVAASALEP